MFKEKLTPTARDLLPVQTDFKTGTEVGVPGRPRGTSGRELVGGVWAVIDIWLMRWQNEEEKNGERQ